MSRTKLLTLASMLSVALLPYAAASGQPAALTDQHGDPLPSGAVARLGTVRMRHGGRIGFVAFLPHGRSVLSVGEDNMVRVWEYPSGKEIRSFGQEVKDEPPTPNGRYGCDRCSGLPVALTKDGKTLVTAFDGGSIRLYDVATGKELTTWKQRGSDDAHSIAVSLAFSPDGKTLTTLADVGTLRHYDWAKKKLLQSFPGDGPNGWLRGGPSFLAYSPDGKVLLSLSGEFVNGLDVYAVKVWDPSSGTKLHTLPKLQGINPLTAISPAFSPDSKYFALPTLDGSIRVYETATCKEHRKIEDRGRGQTATTIFAKDSKTLFARAKNKPTFKEWDIQTGKEVRELAWDSGWQRFVHSDLAMSPDCETLASCGQDHSLHFLHLPTGKARTSMAGHRAAVDAVSFSGDGNMIWTYGVDVGLREWDAATGKVLPALQLPVNTVFARVSQNGQYVAVQLGGQGSGTQVRDLATGKELGTVPCTKNDTLPKMVFAPSAKTLALRWHEGQKIDLYDLPSLQLRCSLSIRTQRIPEESSSVEPIMFFSPDGKRMTAYSEPTVLTVYDTATGQKIWSITPPDRLPVLSGAFTLDGRGLALDLGDGTVAMYEVATAGKRRMYGVKPPLHEPAILPGGCFVLYGHNATDHMPNKLAISPDGKKLAHAGLDRVVHVWDIDTGKELAEFKGHTGTLNAVAFSPNGKLLASAGADTTALVWDVSRVVAPPVAGLALTADQLESHWKMLENADGVTGFAAIRELAAAKETVAFLAERLKPAPKIDKGLVEKLIAALDSNQFKVRQEANAELLKLGERTVPAIDKALAAQPPLETKTRLELLRNKLTGTLLAGEKLQLYRALEVLERIGSAEARQLLQIMADGALGAFSTTTAQEAVTRLMTRR